MVRPEAETKGIAFDLVLDPHLPATIILDRMKLQQVLLNLLSNAVKYSGPGLVRTSVGPLFTDGDGGADRKDRPRMLLFSVVDQGPGIPADQQRRIFDEFIQLDGGVQSRSGGTGLGLSICRRLVRLMGGTIWVESQPPEGSNFSFTLPLTAPDSALEKGEVGEGNGRGDGPCLLLHRVHPGVIPGEAEFGSWGYRIAITTSREDLQGAVTAADPFACVLSTGVDIGAPLAQLAEASALAADRVAWFLIGRSTHGEAIPIGRVVHLGDTLGPRAVARLVRAFGSLPAGSRHLVVDTSDKETAAWVRDSVCEGGLPVQVTGGEGAPFEIWSEGGIVLVLDLMRSPHKAFGFWRKMADRAPRMLVALRYPRSHDHEWIERVDAAWATAADSFLARGPQRLRWMLNAIHTSGSQGRLSAGGLFSEDAPNACERAEPLGRPSRPVLVVEENSENRDLVCRLLLSLDYPYRAACNGAEALALAEGERPSMVLMDLQMPETDGCEVTRAIHRICGSEHLPIVAMTAHVGTEDRRLCHEAGCVDFLPKPIERGDLQRVLHRWIGHAEANPLDRHIPVAPGEDG